MKLSKELQTQLNELAAARGVESHELVAQLVNDAKNKTIGPKRNYRGEFDNPNHFYTSPKGIGTMLHGDSRGMLHESLEPDSVDLIVTSPPFALTREKAYGNETASAYCDWFRPFAAGFHRVLKDSGSLVIDIGGAYKPGLPSRELYQFELLQMLVREYKFELCLEHFWFNTSKMPAPIEWTNIRRIRPKDSVNMVLWLSKTPWPKSSNERVLSPYTKSMRDLLNRKAKTGQGYWSQFKGHTRPSEHKISAVWDQDRGGSIPSNLLAIPNTQALKHYLNYCKENGHTVHPARFPAKLPEHFIRMLTDPGDLVVDPFAGSCAAGEVAESMDRRWIACELNESYIAGARGRFTCAPPSTKKAPKSAPVQGELVDREKPTPTHSRLINRLKNLEQALEKGVHETCDKSIEKTIRGALKTSISQVKRDLLTPDFRWRTDAIMIAPPCALPVRDDVPLDERGGRQSQEVADSGE